MAFDKRRDPYNKGKKVKVSIVAGRFVDWMVGRWEISCLKAVY